MRIEGSEIKMKQNENNQLFSEKEKIKLWISLLQTQARICQSERWQIIGYLLALIAFLLSIDLYCIQQLITIEIISLITLFIFNMPFIIMIIKLWKISSINAEERNNSMQLISDILQEKLTTLKEIENAMEGYSIEYNKKFNKIERNI